MGEYYDWVNVDRKEYISPCDFNYGNKAHESMQRSSEVLRALRELLANEWKGDRIIWLGDECGFPENVATELFDTFSEHGKYVHYSGDIIDIAYDFYKNVSGLFQSAEKEVREEILFYLSNLDETDYIRVNQYGIDINNPYEGLFQRTGRDFKYTINRTKGVYYCFEKTKILNKNGTENDYLDPLPILLGYGRVLSPGPWLGDIIEFTDKIEGNVRLIESITLDI